MLNALIPLIIMTITLHAETTDWEKFNYSFGDTKSKYLSVECCDIDADGDMDLFAGNWNGFMAFYENIGSPDRFSFKMVNSGLNKNESYNHISVGNKAVPRFADIDADGDMDLFVGNNDGNIAFYRNDGDYKHASFKMVRDGSDQANSYFNINTGLAASPYFVDIDNDGDLDLFIGNAMGFISFYKNDGTPTSPIFTKIKGGYSVEDSFDNISTEKYAVPIFRDFNNLGIFDLFMGNWNGSLYFYKNTGQPERPKFSLLSKNFGQINVDGDSSPCFVDLNNDSRDEMIIGNSRGELQIFEPKSGRKLLVFQMKGTSSPSNAIVQNTLPLLQKINEAEIAKQYFEQAQKLYSDGDFIESYNLLETKIKNKNEKVRDLIKNCNQGIQKIYDQELKNSFLMKEVMNEFKTAIYDYTHGNYEKSIETFTTVLNTAPNSKISMEFKIRSSDKLTEQRNNIEAAKSYADGLTEYKNGNMDKALGLIKEALRLSPYNLEYKLNFSNISNIYYTRLNQLYYQTNIMKAGILMNIKKYEDALERLYAVKSLFPDDQEVQKNITLCEDQLVTMNKLNNSKMLKLYIQKGDEAFQMNAFESALKNYNLALKYSPQNAEIKNKISQCQSRMKTTSVTAVDAQAVKEHLQKGLEYYSLNQYENAINEWKKVLDLDPQNQIAQKNIEKAKLLLKK